MLILNLARALKSPDLQIRKSSGHDLAAWSPPFPHGSALEVVIQTGTARVY